MPHPLWLLPGWYAASPSVATAKMVCCLTLCGYCQDGMLPHPLWLLPGWYAASPFVATARIGCFCLPLHAHLSPPACPPVPAVMGLSPWHLLV